MDIADFLRSFVNKTENNRELILMYLKRGNYEFGTLFWKKNNTSYDLIDHVHRNIESNNEYNNKTIGFSPYQHIDNIFISNDGKNLHGYKSDFPITNIIIIPIHVYSNIIGVICLGNTPEEIKDEDTDSFSDLISLSQLIVNKFKLIEDYKKIYSDSTYFSKDLFLANMSHEIRTPLNGIIGFNQLLMNTELNQQQKTYLYSMNHCSLQLMQIINDIIDFSKLSSGNMKTSHDCFSIKESMNSIYETMKERIITKKHIYKCSIEKSVPEFLVLDKQKLIQIIINLLSNSINYTHIGGEISIFISNEKNVLRVSVTDNGIGISEQDQCKLFNSFSQIHNSLTKTGTGLGLAISKRLVELLNGEINVKSLSGQGSTFYFTCIHYPVEDFDEILKRDSKILENKYIIVVDDNEDNRMLLSDILFEWKMYPIMCASAKEAIKLIAANRYEFELGLLDICMPGMNGVELSKVIKHENPLFPLVALSSASEFINISNFDAKLDKPINKLQLFNIIHKIVSQNIKDSAYIGGDEKELRVKTGITSPNNSPISQFNSDIRILIAEDVLYNQTLMYNMATTLGYPNTEVASDGQETIECLDSEYNKKNPFDVLLLDLRMPKMDGYEVIEHVRSKGYPLPKIVAVTASVLNEDRDRCKKMGVQYFITKPIDMNQLRNVLLKLSKIS